MRASGCRRSRRSRAARRSPPATCRSCAKCSAVASRSVEADMLDALIADAESLGAAGAGAAVMDLGRRRRPTWDVYEQAATTRHGQPTA